MSVESGNRDPLQVSREGSVAVVRMNRPAKRNALSLELMRELTEAARRINGDTGIRAVVLAANGDHFCAGVDISPGEMLQGKNETLLEKRQQARIGADMCAAWEGLEQVTVAAIEGHCIGGGLALAASCDFRVAGAGAWFKLPEVALGINMGWHSLPRLVALAGPSRAKRLAVFCEEVTAADALSWGLVDEVTTDGSVLETALGWARRAAALPPLPVRMVKEAVNAVALAHAQATIHMDRDQALLAIQSEDFREAVAAFREKREPRFTGN